MRGDRYSDVKPVDREVIVGESIASGATLTTGSGSFADLLLTNGALAHLGENTKMILSTLYQKSFSGTNQMANELTKEVSPSRIALNLEEGDLVVEVRKLSKESSFLISTPIAHAVIRGTQFKVKASADSAELAVLEGRVDFLDAEELVTPIETAKKAGAVKGGSAKLDDMSASEQAEVRQAVEQSKQAIRDQPVQSIPSNIQDRHGRNQKFREEEEAGYLYSHNFPENISGQSYLEKGLSLYSPKSAGTEKSVAERLDKWKSLKRELNRKKN
jgi:hypothetical protein